jgi:hypothetical protein
MLFSLSSVFTVARDPLPGPPDQLAGVVAHTRGPPKLPKLWPTYSRFNYSPRVDNDVTSLTLMGQILCEKDLS